MFIKSRIIILRTLLAVSTLMIITPSWGMETPFSQNIQRDTIKDDKGHEFYIYKVSGAGLKCGYRVFNIEPSVFVYGLLGHLNDSFTFEEEGNPKKMTVRDIITLDMIGTDDNILFLEPEKYNAYQAEIYSKMKTNNMINISDDAIEKYLSDLYIDGKYFGSGELSEILIPAIAYITDTNVKFYNKKVFKDQTILSLKYSYDPGDGKRNISFYRPDQHYDRLILLPLENVPEEEIKSAERAERVYNYFLEHQGDLKSEVFNELIPRDLEASPRVSAEKRRQDHADKIKTIKEMLNEGLLDNDILGMGYYFQEDINEAKGNIEIKPTNPQEPQSGERVEAIKDIISKEPDTTDYELIEAFGFTVDEIKEARGY